MDARIPTAARPARILIAEDTPQAAELLEAYLCGPEYDLEFEGGPLHDWLLLATDGVVVVGFALVNEETIARHLHLQRIVVESSWRGCGVVSAVNVLSTSQGHNACPLF